MFGHVDVWQADHTRSLSRWATPRIMRYSLLLLPAALTIGGCCTSFTTAVRNETGRDVQFTMMGRSHQTETITIRASSTGRCRGVMPATLDGTTDSWVISDGQSRFTFADLSPIATMPKQFVSSSRFTSNFPCKRVTQHVRIARDMTIHAVRVIGYTELQPAQFPIHYTTKE